MPPSRSWLGIAGVLIGLLAVLFAVFSVAVIILSPLLMPSAPPAEDHPGVGLKLERVDLQPLVNASGPVALEDLSGKVVLVNFWGPWCPPCRVELPHIARLRDEFAVREDFLVLSVSYPANPQTQLPEEPLKSQSAAVLDESGLDLPIYFDPNLETAQAFDAVVGFGTFPTTFVLNRQGLISGVWQGLDPRDVEKVPREIETVVRRLLDEGA